MGRFQHSFPDSQKTRMDFKPNQSPVQSNHRVRSAYCYWQGMDSFTILVMPSLPVVLFSKQ